MRFIFLFLLFFFQNLYSLTAQPDANPPDNWLKKAEQLIEQGEIEQAQIWLRKGQKQSLSEKNWQTYIETGIDIAYLSRKKGDMKLAIAQMDSLLHFSTEQIGQKHPSIGLAYHKLGVLYYINDQYPLAVQSFEKAINIRQEVLKPLHPDLGGSYFNAGLCARFAGDYNKAIHFFDEAIEIRKTLDNKLPLTQTYQQIGTIYELLGDYSKALFYQESSLELFKSIYENEEENEKIANTYYNIALLFESTNQPQKGIAAVSKAINIFQKLNIVSEEAISFNLLGNIYEDQQDFSNALNALQRSLTLNEEVYGENSKQIADNHNNIGIIYKKTKDFSLAIASLEKSLQIRQQLYPNQKHPEIAISYDNLGNVYHEKGELDKAIEMYDLAITNLLPQINDIATLSPNSFNTSDQKPHLLIVLSDKAETLLALYHQKNQIEYLHQTLNTYQLIDHLINKMRQEFGADGSKLFWIDRTRGIYENAIATALLLYEKNKEKEYFDKAFAFAEKSKAALLLESRREVIAKSLANIDEKTLNEEKIFKEKINKLERLIEEVESKEEQAFRNVSLKDSLVQINRAYENFIEQLEQEYPQYHQLKYDTKIAQVTDIQQTLLENHQLLLEWFVGEKEVFVFAISSKTTAIHRLPLPKNLSEIVTKFRQSLTDKKGIENDLATNYKNFSYYAFKIYETFLSPVLKNQATDIEHLILIPDGLLSYIPFECLLTAAIDADTPDFFGLPYLIQQFSISYSYSSTLLQENQRRTEQLENNGQLLAFAPQYPQNGPLVPLPGAKMEVQNILNLYPKNQPFLEQQATKAAFQQNAENFGIIHLAMHAQVDNENMNQSKLFFTPLSGDPNNDNTLFNDELSQLNINAAMVVLSACETGLGQLIRGEGVMSLARGFMNAGSPNVVMSLWQTNDKASQQIMVDFHKNLTSGLSKNKALQQSKLQYLSNPIDPIAHPYYWAGFVTIGDYGTIGQNSGGYWWIFIIGGIVILAFFVNIFKNFKK